MMEIKIDIKVNLSNVNQIIDKLTQITNKSTSIQNLHTNNATLENSDKKIDITIIREEIGELTNSGNISQVQELLRKYNAKKVSQVEAKDYEKLYLDIIKIKN